MTRKELEEYVLRTLVFDGLEHPEWVMRLRPEFFGSNASRAAYEFLAKCITEKVPFDILSLQEFLEARIEKGAAEYACKITNAGKEPGEPGAYVDKLVEKGLRDQFAKKAQEVVEKARSRASSDSLRGALSELCDCSLDPRPVAYEEIYDKAKETITDEQFYGGAIIDCGLPGMEDYYPAADYLTIIAARPSVGKTMMGVNIAETLNRNGLEPLFYSLEQSDVSIVRRRVALISGIGITRLRIQGSLTEREMGIVNDTIEKMKNTKLWIKAGSLGANQLCTSIVSEKKKRPNVKAVFVDHLGLVGFGKGDHYEEIGKFTRKLASIAKEYQLAVFLLAQLNRPKEGGSSMALERIAESDKVGQDADLVWMLERNVAGDKVTVHVMKNREGPTGRVQLDCDLKNGRIGIWRDLPDLGK